MYYLEGSADYGVGSTSDASGVRTAAELRAASFAETLGSAFAADADALNDGYPVLVWQVPVRIWSSAAMKSLRRLPTRSTTATTTRTSWCGWT